MHKFSWSCFIGHQLFQPEARFKLMQKNTVHSRFSSAELDAEEKLSNELEIYLPARQGKHKSHRSKQDKTLK